VRFAPNLSRYWTKTLMRMRRWSATFRRFFAARTGGAVQRALDASPAVDDATDQQRRSPTDARPTSAALRCDIVMAERSADAIRWLVDQSSWDERLALFRRGSEIRTAVQLTVPSALRQDATGSGVHGRS